MKIKIILSLLLVIFALPIYSQQLLYGSIKDAVSKEPIPFCYIVYISKNKQIATTSNESGRYILDINKKESDSIFISSVGYETRFLLFQDLIKEPDIVLKRQNFLLDELSIKAK